MDKRVFPKQDKWVKKGPKQDKSNTNINSAYLNYSSLQVSSKSIIFFIFKRIFEHQHQIQHIRIGLSTKFLLKEAFFVQICQNRIEETLFIINNPHILNIFSYYEVHSLKKLFKKFVYPFLSLKTIFENSANFLVASSPVFLFCSCFLHRKIVLYFSMLA